MSCDSKESWAPRMRWEPLPWLLGAAALALAALALGAPGQGGAALAMAAVVAVLAVSVRRRLAVSWAESGRWRELATAIDALPQACLVIDSDGREVHRNAAAAEVFGEAADPLAPLAARAGHDGRTAEEAQRLNAAAAHRLAHRAELVLGAEPGDREWLVIAVRPVGSPPRGVLWSAEDVTARRAIEETLRREVEMLADFIDFVPVGLYSADTEGRFRFVNQRLAEWLGLSPENLIGREARDVLGVLPDPEDDRAEMRLKGRNGDVFQAFVTHAVFDDGGETLTRSVVVRDLMPERMWEKSLKAAERRFRWLFDDAPVGIALVDPDGTISASNPAFRTMLACEDDDPAGRAVSDYIAAEDRQGAGDQLSKVLMGTSPGAHLEVRLHGRREIVASMREIVASMYVSPTGEDGDVSGLMLHFIDTTEQKNLEIQFAQSQKMQAMGQLAGGVAHDFNNLLTAMIGFGDLLLQRHGPGDASFADIMQIKQNANRAASLVRQLLAFSRRQAMQPRPVNVTDALTELSNLLRRLLGETIELKIAHGRDVGVVRVDPGQFDQVIINLAVNARDAMPGGGGLVIRTAAASVERPVQRGPEVMPPGDYVLIEVKDTGIGIAKENIGRIFEPFFSTKAVGAGTGLGLSTVYGIVRQTDGFIFVDSAPGQGAVFSIYLPRAEAEPAAAAVAEKPKGADLTGAGTILLVEDEDAVRLFASRALRNKGYTVLEARSGEGALDVLRTSEHIDAIVSDVVMPGMDGATLAGLVRIERPEIRVILISGYSEDVALDQFSGADGIHFLPKPFSLQQLAGKVKEVLGG